METEEDEPRISFIGSEATKLLKDYLRRKKTESEYASLKVLNATGP